MRIASAEFKQLMQIRTDFREKAVMTLADGTILNLGASDFSISNNNVNDSAGATLPLGVAVEKTIQIELTNHDDRYANVDFYGATIDLALTYPLSTTTAEFTMGRYTVIDPENYGTVVLITAVDAMYKADKPFSSSLSMPSTLGALFRDICASMAITYVSDTFLNHDIVISELPSDVTYRQMLGYIACIACGNARVTYDGRMEIITYGARTDVNVLDSWQSLTVSTDDVAVTGISATIEGEEVLIGSEGYVLKIVDNPFINEDVLQAMDDLVGLTMRPFNGTHIAYPLAEFMDKAQIVDRNGNTYNTILTNVQFAFFSYSSFECNAESVMRNSSTYNATLAEVYIKAKTLVEQEKSERETAIEELGKKIITGGGTYLTEKILEDGSTVYYLHNTNDEPNESGIFPTSNLVWKMTANGFGISNDYGATYPLGLDSWGNAIMNIVSATGISADWITTGALTIGSGDNILFKADATNATVKIGGYRVGKNFMVGENKQTAPTESDTDTRYATILYNFGGNANNIAFCTYKSVWSGTVAVGSYTSYIKYDGSCGLGGNKLKYDASTNVLSLDGNVTARAFTAYGNNSDISIRVTDAFYSTFGKAYYKLGIYEETIDAGGGSTVTLKNPRFSFVAHYSTSAKTEGTYNGYMQFEDTRGFVFSKLVTGVNGANVPIGKYYLCGGYGGLSYNITSDGDEYIRVGNTDMATRFYGGSADGYCIVALTNGVFRPTSTYAGSVSLGLSSNRWGAYYGTSGNFSDDLTVSGAITANGNFTINRTSATAQIILKSSGQGYIYFYGNKQSTYYTRLRPSSTYTANYSLTLPASTGTLATSGSDVRLKENIVNAEGSALELINKFVIRSFDWKADGRHNSYGIVADEVERILPTLVRQDGEDTKDDPSYKYIDLMEYCALLAKAVQELSKKLK